MARKKRMLSDEFTSVSESRDCESLCKAVLLFAKRLGFDRMSAMAVRDHPETGSDFAMVDNTPPAYSRLFHDPAAWRRDPVMQHCRLSALPIVWDRDTYAAAGLLGKW